MLYFSPSTLFIWTFKALFFAAYTKISKLSIVIGPKKVFTKQKNVGKLDGSGPFAMNHIESKAISLACWIIFCIGQLQGFFLQLATPKLVLFFSCSSVLTRLASECNKSISYFGLLYLFSHNRSHCHYDIFDLTSVFIKRIESQFCFATKYRWLFKLHAHDAYN